MCGLDRTHVGGSLICRVDIIHYILRLSVISSIPYRYGWFYDNTYMLNSKIIFHTILQHDIDSTISNRHLEVCFDYKKIFIYRKHFPCGWKGSAVENINRGVVQYFFLCLAYSLLGMASECACDYCIIDYMHR